MGRRILSGFDKWPHRTARCPQQAAELFFGAANTLGITARRARYEDTFSPKRPSRRCLRGVEVGGVAWRSREQNGVAASSELEPMLTSDM